MTFYAATTLHRLLPSSRVLQDRRKLAPTTCTNEGRVPARRKAASKLPSRVFSVAFPIWAEWPNWNHLLFHPGKTLFSFTIFKISSKENQRDTHPPLTTCPGHALASSFGAKEREMRFSFLAMTISMLLLSDSRAQEAPPVVNHAETSARAAPLPDMPAPKPSAPGCSGLRTSCLHPKRDGNDLNLQQWPSQSRVADKKFWTVAGGTIGSSLLVVAATNHCWRTVGIENCIGGYGPFKAIQGLQVGLSGVMTGLAYFWKKSEQERGRSFSNAVGDVRLHALEEK